MDLDFGFSKFRIPKFQVLYMDQGSFVSKKFWIMSNGWFSEGFFQVLPRVNQQFTLKNVLYRCGALYHVSFHFSFYQQTPKWTFVYSLIGQFCNLRTSLLTARFYSKSMKKTTNNGCANNTFPIIHLITISCLVMMAWPVFSIHTCSRLQLIKKIFA